MVKRPEKQKTSPNIQEEKLTSSNPTTKQGYNPSVNKFSDSEIEKHINSLIPEVREVLNKSIDERIDFALTDKFIAHSATLQVISYLELLMRIPKKPRMKGLILYGESGTGKTMLIHEFRKRYEEKVKPDDDYDEIPILIVETPTEPKEKELYARILDTIGVPYRKTDDLLAKEKSVCHYCNLLNVNS